MKLISYRVRLFRNIIDSGPIAVEPDVTCLVGKNEAGKSALLEALYLLEPAYDEKFDLEQQYPRWLLVEHRRKGDISTFAPIEATFFMEDDEATEIERILGEGALASRSVTVKRAYNDKKTFQFDLDERRAVATVLEGVGSTTGLPAAVRDAASLTLLDKALEGALAGMDDGIALKVRLQKLVERRTQQHQTRSSWQIAYDVVKSRVPRHFHFTGYNAMPGTVDFNEIAMTTDSEPGKGGIQAIRALLRLAGTNPSALSNNDYELRRAELDAVQIDLTRQVFQYWRQNPALQVQIDVDKKTVRDQQGQHAVARTLHIRVMDNRTGYGNNFSQRSSGFQWFFSFLAAFSEFEHSDRPTIVLLDEPGLSLHGRAQGDYLRFIDERLAPLSQVLYTTHSPFMVKVNELERVRLIEDRGPDQWSIALQDVFAGSSDSLFPLQAALGYDIAQQLFIGPANVVIEGTSDFVYLTTLSDILLSLGRTGLDSAWRILPAGGSSNIPTFVALIGPHLGVTVVADSSQQGMQRLLSLEAKGLLAPGRLITIGSVLGQTYADIEDLFSLQDYLNLYNGAFATDVRVANLSPGDRIVERIAHMPGNNAYDHGVPADYLLRNKPSVTPDDVTLANFEALFQKINATLAIE